MSRLGRNPFEKRSVAETVAKRVAELQAAEPREYRDEERDELPMEPVGAGPVSASAFARTLARKLLVDLPAESAVLAVKTVALVQSVRKSR